MVLTHMLIIYSVGFDTKPGNQNVKFHLYKSYLTAYISFFSYKHFNIFSLLFLCSSGSGSSQEEVTHVSGLTTSTSRTAFPELTKRNKKPASFIPPLHSLFFMSPVTPLSVSFHKTKKPAKALLKRQQKINKLIYSLSYYHRNAYNFIQINTNEDFY